jgi:hypothetical protein
LGSDNSHRFLFVLSELTSGSDSFHNLQPLQPE